MTFENINTVALGDNNLGTSNVSTVSIMAVDCAGDIGVFVDGAFYPQADGTLAAGDILTFVCGVGRELGFNATTAGKLTINKAI